MSIKGTQNFDHERVKFNVARMTKAGKHFEVVVDPDLAIQYKNSKSVDAEEVLKSEKVFSHAVNGIVAKDQDMKDAFGTTDHMEVAKILLDHGEIQLTGEYREEKRKEKRNRLIDIIRRNAVDPKTGLPHPAKRIELAFEEAKIALDDMKSADEQVNDVMKKLNVILPIRMEIDELKVVVPAQFAAKSFSTIKKNAKILREAWQNDGSLLCIVEVPAGIKQDFIDSMNSLTHGNVEIETESKRDR